MFAFEFKLSCKEIDMAVTDQEGVLEFAWLPRLRFIDPMKMK